MNQMWIESNGYLLNIDEIVVIQKDDKYKIHFRFGNREGYHNIFYDSTEKRDSEFKRIEGLLLKNIYDSNIAGR